MKKTTTKKQTTKRKPKASKAVDKPKNEAMAASTIASDVDEAYREIVDILQTGRSTAYRAVNTAMVQYTLLKESQPLFASPYQLYLPTEEELQRALQAERARLELEQELHRP